MSGFFVVETFNEDLAISMEKNRTKALLLGSQSEILTIKHL